MQNKLKKNYITNDDIIIEPNDILKKLSKEVELPLNKDDRHTLKTLYNHVANSQDEEYLAKYDVRPAVGIAAIQVGIPKRLIAIKVSDEEGNIYKYMLANPIYLDKSDEMCYLTGGEGCLSVEENRYEGIVPRHYEISIKAYNLFSNKVETIELTGYVAIVMQHEIDHLDGILYIDKINKLNPFLKKDEWIEI